MKHCAAGIEKTGQKPPSNESRKSAVMSSQSSKWKRNKRCLIFVVSTEIFEHYHGKYILRKLTKKPIRKLKSS